MGLVGLSIQTSFVFGRSARATFSGAVMSTASNETPCRRKTLSKMRKVPPYTSSQARTWSPDESRWRTASVAASPEAKASPCRPPSSAARQSCSAWRVGFCVREYSNPLWTPGPSCT